MSAERLLRLVVRTLGLSILTAVMAGPSIASGFDSDPAAQTLEGLLQPGAAMWSRGAAQQDSAIRVLCSAVAAQRSAALANARASWVATMRDWRRLGILPVKQLFGGQLVYGTDWPTVNIGLLDRSIDFMVPATEAASAVIKASERPRSLDQISVEVRGMATLAYLLWPDSDARSAPRMEQPRTCRYATLLSEDILRKARRLEADSKSTSLLRQSAARPSTEATANEILLNAIVDGLRQLRKRHAPLLPVTNARSVPTTPDRITDVDGGRMQESAEFFQASVEVLRLATLGDNGAAHIPGLAESLRSQGHDELVSPLRQRFDTLRADSQRLPPRLLTTDAQHRALAKLIAADTQQLINQLSGPTAIALGVVVGFGDGDGG